MNATWLHTSLLLITTLGAASALAGDATVRGYWVDAAGSVLEVAPCQKALCVQIVALPAGPHPTTDAHNPDPSLRSRPLCGLRIGEGFIAKDPQHADGGRIYDPRSGRTYHATMKAEDDRLELRGFVGVRLFGRTETWHRARGTPHSCGGE